MAYFNFFSQYESGKGKNSGFNVKKGIVLGCIIAVVCALIYLYYSFLCGQYQSQLDYLNRIKMNDGFIRQYSVAMEVAEQIDSTSKDLKYMESLNQYVRTVSTANPSLMRLIDASLTDAAYLRSMVLEKNTVTLEGYAPNVETLTAIERNFRASNAFLTVLVSKAENQTENADIGMIAFTCRLELNGGAILDE